MGPPFIETYQSMFHGATEHISALYLDANAQTHTKGKTMAQYKIVGSYRIMDVEPNPDVTLAPNPASPNATYAFSVDTPEELEALIIANAEIKAAGSSSTSTADAAVVAQFQANEDTIDS